MGLTVPNECVKFRAPRLNRSGEIRHKAVGCGIFGRFLNFDKNPPEKAGDVISSTALDNASMDVFERFGDFRLNSS